MKNKVKSIIIYSEERNMYLAYLKDFPGVCVQSENLKDLQNKLNESFAVFCRMLSETEIDFDLNKVKTYL